MQWYILARIEADNPKESSTPLGAALHEESRSIWGHDIRKSLHMIGLIW